MLTCQWRNLLNAFSVVTVEASSGMPHLGGTKDEALEKLIDIDGVTESVVYGFAVGK